MTDWYKELWSRIGGRPWTYIWRDIYHEAEWLIQLIWFATGAGASIVILKLGMPWWFLGIAWAVYTFGYVNGHFFWGTRWIKGQKGR